MVVSNIDTRVNYRELKTIPSVDVKKTLELYQIEVHDIEIIIAIGSPNKEFEDSNIIYYPIYLVNKTNKVIQIGLYEIQANEFVSMYSDDNDLLIDNLDDPLIFSYVNKKMLNDTRLKPELQINDYDLNDYDEEEDTVELKYKSKVVSSKIYKIPPERQELFMLTTDEPPEIELLNEESKEDAKDITAKYHFNDSDLWIQKCLKNKMYDIQNVESNGDCFFATIREAFATIGHVTTVLKLRKRLSEIVTQDMFQIYSDLFTSTTIEIKQNKDALKKVNENIKNIAENFKNTLNVNEKRKMASDATKLKSEKQRLANELKLAISFLREYKFMKGVNNINKLKAKILNNDFWADDWAVSSMEPLLNIKFIILSSQEFEHSNNCDMVLTCGQTNQSLMQSDVFSPEFYIMLEYTGNHYKLISYKNKSLFKFDEIPYDVKMLIISKCLEKNSGSFSFISDFVSLKNSLPNILNKPIIEDTYVNAINNDLFDEDIVFAFNSRSTIKNSPLPGKGNGGEKIPEEKIKMFGELHGIEKWRNKLSNFWSQEFILHDRKWQSVEHYYQAAKFKMNNPDFYLTFSLDSGTELSRDSAMAKGAGGKNGKFKGKIVRPASIIMDHDFNFSKEMHSAQNAKFTQNEDLKILLLATKSAKLTHWVRASPNLVFTELMQIREDLFRQIK
jgi:predicted NAD-dependent protein-ADP-ribosyltransferase YbiA (DUF1768 family)